MVTVDVTKSESLDDIVLDHEGFPHSIIRGARRNADGASDTTVQKAWQDPLHDLWMGHPASDFWPPELQVNVSEMPIVLSHSFW